MCFFIVLLDIGRCTKEKSQKVRKLSENLMSQARPGQCCSAHMFGDILDRFPSGTFSGWESFHDLMRRALTSPFNHWLWCYSCCSWCAVPSVDVLAAGIPCTDWSPTGLQLGLLGPTAPVLATYVREMLETDPPLGLFENVPEFNLDVLHLFLGARFWIIPFPPVKTEHCGYGLIRRDRVFVALVSKRKAVVETDMVDLYNKVTSRLMAQATTEPKAALIADDAELQRELAKLCERRGVPLNPCTRPTDTLTWREREAVRTYCRLYRERSNSLAEADANLFTFLGDSPPARVSWSAASNTIPTLRTNSGLLFHPMSQSWLLPKELLAIMGFPVYRELAESMNTRQLHLEPDAYRSAIGNCMHLGSAYLVLLCCLSCVRIRIGSSAV